MAIVYRYMRESFDDTRRGPEVDWRDRRMMVRRLLDRPFWCNIRRQHWRYRLPFYNGEHWRILADGMTSRGWTARECYFRWSTARRYWMPHRTSHWNNR